MSTVLMKHLPQKYSKQGSFAEIWKFSKRNKNKNNGKQRRFPPPKPKLNIVLNVAQIIKYGQGLARFEDKNEKQKLTTKHNKS